MGADDIFGTHRYGAAPGRRTRGLPQAGRIVGSRAASKPEVLPPAQTYDANPYQPRYVPAAKDFSPDNTHRPGDRSRIAAARTSRRLRGVFTTRPRCVSHRPVRLRSWPRCRRRRRRLEHCRDPISTTKESMLQSCSTPNRLSRRSTGYRPRIPGPPLVELRGLEPLTPTLPARVISQIPCGPVSPDAITSLQSLAFMPRRVAACHVLPPRLQ